MERPQSIIVSLPVADRLRAMEFYRGALGWAPIGEPVEDGVPEPLQFRLDEHTVLMLIPVGGFGWVLADRAVAPPAMSECLLSVVVAGEQSVVDIAGRMRDAGGELIAEPTRRDWGFSAVVTDLDGHAWQLVAG